VSGKKIFFPKMAKAKKKIPWAACRKKNNFPFEQRHQFHWIQHAI
jgi:hypothetical protein